MLTSQNGFRGPGDCYIYWLTQIQEQVTHLAGTFTKNFLSQNSNENILMNTTEMATIL